MKGIVNPPPKILILAASAVTIAQTGNTNEVTLATIPVKAGSLGLNGRLRVTTVWGFTNNANVKTGRVVLGGTALAVVAGASFGNIAHQTEICNRNAQNVQFARANVTGSAGFGATTTAVQLGAVDTSTDQNLTITAQLANAADIVTLESYLVELIRP